MAKNFEKKLAEKAAPKKGIFARATEWLSGPGSDDFHGLVQRFGDKSKNKGIHRELTKLRDSYVDQYQKHLTNATKVRENVWNAENKLMKAMGLGDFKDFSRKGTLADTVMGQRGRKKR